MSEKSLRVDAVQDALQASLCAMFSGRMFSSLVLSQCMCVSLPERGQTSQEKVCPLPSSKLCQWEMCPTLGLVQSKVQILLSTGLLSQYVQETLHDRLPRQDAIVRKQCCCKEQCDRGRKETTESDQHQNNTSFENLSIT